MNKIYILGFLLLVLISCVDEDPKLVNPPPPFQSIRIRLLNAINSDDNISWGFNNSPYSNSVKYLELTNSQMPPPYDSLALEFYQNNKLTYTSNRKIRLVRETRYLIVAGKSLGEGLLHIDTFMILSTTYGLPTKLGNAYFKFVNLVRDSNLSATLIDGCPNGRPLVSNVTYFAYPFLQTIPYGNYTLSVVLNDGVKSGLLNTFSVNFSEDGEYTLLLAKKRDGTIGFYLYDDYDTTKGLVELLPIAERVSYLRTVNLSSENISLFRFPNQVLNEDIPQNWSTKYHSISACENNYLDSIEVKSSNSYNILGYSFEVFKKYTLLVFDSIENQKKLILVPPAKLRESTNGRSIIRVVNAVDTNFAITFSVGTRNSKNNNYFSGEVISANLKSNRVSNPVFIEPGYLPLTIFSATEPAFLLKSTYTEVAADYAYLIVLHKSSDGELKVSFIPEDREDFSAIQLETGCFVQVLNAFPDTPSLNISFSKYLQNIKINYKESFATVLPTSVNGIYYNGNQKEITLDPSKNGLFVFSGLNLEIDLFDISIPSMGKETNSLRRRFFNASKEIENVGIFHDSSKQKIVLNELKYGQYSSVERVFLERKFSLVYFDNYKNKVISQFNDIFLSFGKNYTLVFSGNKSKSFTLIVVQEY